jgi:CRP/FNR family transcriptional regulator
MPIQTLATFLKAVVYFKTASDDALQTLATHALRRSFRAGEMIFREGEQNDGLWIVASGRVKLYKLNPKGEDFTLVIAGISGTFNDVAAFDSGITPGHAAALSDCTCYVLPQAALLHAVAHDPAIAVQVTRALAARLRWQFERLEELTLCDVHARVARFLLKQRSNPQLSGPGITRTAIAAHLATTPQTISNILRALAEQGAIAYDRQQVHILDEALLRHISTL